MRKFKNTTVLSSKLRISSSRLLRRGKLHKLRHRLRKKPITRKTRRKILKRRLKLRRLNLVRLPYLCNQAHIKRFLMMRNMTCS